MNTMVDGSEVGENIIQTQHIDVDFDGSVQFWLDSELGHKWRSGEFNAMLSGLWA